MQKKQYMIDGACPYMSNWYNRDSITNYEYIF